MELTEQCWRQQEIAEALGVSPAAVSKWGTAWRQGGMDAVLAREFLAAGVARRIHWEKLPPYALDINPVEELWRQLKHVEMRNVVCRDLEELHLEFHLAKDRVRQKTHLLKSFFAAADLGLRTHSR